MSKKYINPSGLTHYDEKIKSVITENITEETNRATAKENELSSNLSDVNTSLSSHSSNISNPHKVTKSQVGLSNVDNTSDINKPVSTAQQASIDEAYANATTYTDTKIADLINGAPTTLDTLGEIASAMEESQDVVDALNESIGTKASQSELDTHTGNGTIHLTASERTNWNAAKTHADSAHAPSNAQANVIETVKVNGTALTPSSKAVNITVPTKVSQLTNDSGYKTTDNNTTYSLSKSGSTITLTGSDGSETSVTDSNTTYSNATTSSSGLMSSSDKTKLDGITDSADSVSFSRNLTSGTKVGTITINGTGTDLYAPTNTDTHYASKNAVGSSTATSNTTTALTNGNVYLNSVENGSVTSSHKISGSGATTVTTDTSGNIVITSTDTKYTHPSYTARTGVPTANQTPGFGGTFTVTQPVSDAAGHITAMTSRTITIPSAVATTSANGLMSSTDKSKLDGIATGATKVTVDNSLSSTSTNPVQNKIIYSALDGKANKIDTRLIGTTYVDNGIIAANETTDTEGNPVYTQKSLCLNGGLWISADGTELDAEVLKQDGVDLKNIYATKAFSTVNVTSGVNTYTVSASSKSASLGLTAGNNVTLNTSGSTVTINSSQRSVTSSLTSTSDTTGLSASAGKSLQDQITTLNSNLDNYSFNNNACKNLLENTYGSKSENGITYTLNDNGSITANGTATANSFCYIGNINLYEDANVILNGCPSGGDTESEYYQDSYFLYCGQKDYGGSYYDYGKGVKLSFSKNTRYTIIICIRKGVTVENLTFYPMVRYANIADDTYEQYFPTNKELYMQVKSLKEQIENI